MKKNLAAAALVFLASAVSAHGQGKSASQVADLVVLHGKVYTANPSQPWAEAIGVRSGKIVAVGSNDEVQKFRASGTKVDLVPSRPLQNKDNPPSHRR